MKGKSEHSKEFRERIAREAIESKRVAAVAKKYDLKATNVYSWVKTYRNKKVAQSGKSIRDYERELADKELENQVLRELLKKTTNVLVPDFESLQHVPLGVFQGSRRSLLSSWSASPDEVPKADRLKKL